MKESYVEAIKRRLIELKPYRAILFGSYASGMPREDSDIDLIVVLNKKKMPKTFSERMENHYRIRKHLKDINKNIGIDLLVYTKGEWNELAEIDSSFLREIMEKGKILL
jgi:predicted nucleotidyltransferase